MSEYRKIFVSFFKIGLFTFGGGYAMMPLFRQELIDKHKYITENELIDYYSIGQCTPGVIAVNVATFTGYKIKGVAGAAVATLAIVLPSLVIIMALAGILQALSDNQIVSHAFAGIRIGVIALVLNEVIHLFKKAVSSRLQLGIFMLILAVLLLGNVSAIMAVMMAAGVGGVRFMRLK
ncbi:MAG: chromate transporter [Alphaproteobacteria bacterium]|nr:chromate transporter [Alphaproteobacteria bacterium]